MELDSMAEGKKPGAEARTPKPSNPTIVHAILDTKKNEIFKASKAERDALFAKYKSEDSARHRYKIVGYFKEEKYADMFCNLLARGYTPDYYALLSIENETLHKILKGNASLDDVDIEHLNALIEESMLYGGGRTCLGECRSNDQDVKCCECFLTDPRQWTLCANISVLKRAKADPTNGDTAEEKE